MSQRPIPPAPQPEKPLNESWISSRRAAALSGMTLAFHAHQAPERSAILSPYGDRSFGELNARCNQLVRALRARGLERGDHLALLCANRPEFAEAIYAGARCGIRITPINWHLSGEEMGYIVDNCEARAFLADARFAEAAREAVARAPRAEILLAMAGSIPGFNDYEEALGAESGTDIEDPILGGTMLYTSGTTGRPKGVYRRRVPRPTLLGPLTETASFSAGDLALCTGPLYHAAPLGLNLAFPLNLGAGVVLMDKWTPEETLRLVEKHAITHTHMVPTMFHRLLRLPEEVRRRHDLSSLRFVLHGAAPCPVSIKQQIMDWLGPVVHEYYAATEGGGTFISAEDWLRKPGSVGRPVPGQEMSVLDDHGRELPDGDVGTVYFKAPEKGRFEYFKASEKTASAYRGEHFTLGDHGYRDTDGYYFLTGRSAEVIITGGVNVYPAEIDSVLLAHPAVSDVATVGVPNDEWGEEVKAVVQLDEGAEPSDALAEELLGLCRAELATFKCPRSIDFAEDLPRMPTGKIQRGSVRARYWADRDKSI